MAEGQGQQTAVYDRDTAAAEDTEDALIRLVWRDGVCDAEETAALHLARRSVELSDTDAHGKRLALAVLRLEADAPRVRRLRRERPEIWPSDEAA